MLLLASLKISFAQGELTVQFSPSLSEEIKRKNVHDVTQVYTIVNPEQNLIVYGKDEQIQKLATKEAELYVLHKGETLRQALNRWAEMNGYTVVYQTDIDFTISQTTEIYANFLEKGGALEQVLESLSKSSHPLQVEVMSNKVLVVKSSHYSPSLLIPHA